MSDPKYVTYQMHQDNFNFLGVENILTENSDFGYFWNHFFQIGGYDKIIPYAIDTKPLNVWYTNDIGQAIYFQGLMVDKVNEIPDGYTFARFPESDFLVITHEWLSTNEEALNYGIDACWKYEKTAPIPDGYVRFDGSGSPITLIEKENSDTPDGSRYEFWIPIKRSEIDE